MIIEKGIEYIASKTCGLLTNICNIQELLSFTSKY